MAKQKITIRMFIEAALVFSEARCDLCNSKLESVWIGEETNPDLSYIRCPRCEEEYDLVVAFVRDTTIPKGR